MTTKENVFCIIKYSVWFRTGEYMSTKYELLTLTHENWDYSMKEISAQEAKKIISHYEMKEKIHNKHGQVWELPRQSFKRRFRGKYVYDKYE
jgi:hypothetical protein